MLLKKELAREENKEDMTKKIGRVQKEETEREGEGGRGKREKT